jgi:NAD(P)-dependent dehydrogenase (short-subunit alcohol dehydrogenase family)
MFELEGRVALVTGAGRGVGVGIAETLARQGARVAVNDLQEDRAQSTVDAITAAGGVAIAVAFDVSDHDATADGIAAVVAQLGDVDIVVNNAGIPPGRIPLSSFVDSDPGVWHHMVDVNLYGVLNTAHLTVRGMCERGWGRVVTISSEAGRHGMAEGVALYGASKAGAIGFMKHLALEVAPLGVTANCIALGLMDNNGGKWGDAAAASMPRRRLGTGADAGAAVAYLASSEADWVTGQVLPVNGGIHT